MLPATDSMIKVKEVRAPWNSCRNNPRCEPRQLEVIGAGADGIADRELIVCVVTAVRKLEFDKPQSGGKLRVAYPFKFEPRPAK